MPPTALAPGGLIGGVARRASRSASSPASPPYNFPIVNMAGKLGPALAMGNTVVVKPAPQDPLAHHASSARSAARGRLPAGRRQRRHRLRRRGRRRRSSRRRTSTWSASPAPPPSAAHRRGRGRGDEAPAARARRQGRGDRVRRRRPRRPRSAAIVSAWAFHSGQICTAPTRVLVHRSSYDQLVEPARRRARRSLKVGDPLEPPTPSSVRSSPRSTATGSRATSAGRDAGRRPVVAGGERPDLERGLLRRAHAARRLQAPT